MKSELEKYRHKISPDVFKVIQEVIDDPELSKDSENTCDVCENDPMAHFACAPINPTNLSPTQLQGGAKIHSSYTAYSYPITAPKKSSVSILGFIKKILPF